MLQSITYNSQSKQTKSSKKNQSTTQLKGLSLEDAAASGCDKCIKELANGEKTTQGHSDQCPRKRAPMKKKKTPAKAKAASKAPKKKASPLSVVDMEKRRSQRVNPPQVHLKNGLDMKLQVLQHRRVTLNMVRQCRIAAEAGLCTAKEDKELRLPTAKEDEEFHEELSMSKKREQMELPEEDLHIDKKLKSSLSIGGDSRDWSHDGGGDFDGDIFDGLHDLGNDPILLDFGSVTSKSTDKDSPTMQSTTTLAAEKNQATILSIFKPSCPPITFSFNNSEEKAESSANMVTPPADPTKLAADYNAADDHKAEDDCDGLFADQKSVEEEGTCLPRKVEEEKCTREKSKAEELRLQRKAEEDKRIEKLVAEKKAVAESEKSVDEKKEQESKNLDLLYQFTKNCKEQAERERLKREKEAVKRAEMARRMPAMIEAVNKMTEVTSKNAEQNTKASSPFLNETKCRGQPSENGFVPPTEPWHIGLSRGNNTTSMKRNTDTATNQQQEKTKSTPSPFGSASVCGSSPSPFGSVSGGGALNRGNNTTSMKENTDIATNQQQEKTKSTPFGSSVSGSTLSPFGSDIVSGSSPSPFGSVSGGGTTNTNHSKVGNNVTTKTAKASIIPQKIALLPSIDGTAFWYQNNETNQITRSTRPPIGVDDAVYQIVTEGEDSGNRVTNYITLAKLEVFTLKHLRLAMNEQLSASWHKHHPSFLFCSGKIIPHIDREHTIFVHQGEYGRKIRGVDGKGDGSHDNPYVVTVTSVDSTPDDASPPPRGCCVM